GVRSEERSVVGNYVSTAEVRLTTQTGPSHPHPGVGGVSNASTAECHARRRIQVSAAKLKSSLQVRE
ncbi:MAG: hypothetical protein GX934_07800, partial [Burkholderiales bacterium]|nr:hypothetical protein [Burkholderiales bacterium]